MEERDRRAAVALATLERPDVRALQSRLESIAKKLDDLVQTQDQEIEGLRRLLVSVSAAYRDVDATKWKIQKKVDHLFRLLGLVCLEADAIIISGGLPPKRRPAKRSDRG